VDAEAATEQASGTEPAIQRAKPRPVSGGHVKVLGPVSRPERPER
jgi:hypothetical protein